MSKKYVEIDIKIAGTTITVGETLENKSFVEDVDQYKEAVERLLLIKAELSEPVQKKIPPKKKPQPKPQPKEVN